MFAINQANPGVDLDAGRTLAVRPGAARNAARRPALSSGPGPQKAMDLSTAVLVVLDKAAVPLTRLWCLCVRPPFSVLGCRSQALPPPRESAVLPPRCRYEIGHAPQEKLKLLAGSFTGAELAAACAKIDVGSAGALRRPWGGGGSLPGRPLPGAAARNARGARGLRTGAGCFDASAKNHILRSITAAHVSVGAFTAFLKLRFLLDPTSYAGDIQARARGRPVASPAQRPGGRTGAASTPVGCACPAPGPRRC